MTPLDWAAIAVYLTAMLAMSLWVGRRQTTADEYYLAGRKLGGTTVAFSMLATQASAISLIGAPAFVALRPGGGLIWLQYEFAVPLAMIGLLYLILPAFHAARVTSIYEILEQRFGPGMRRGVGAVFLVSRGLATGTALYAASLVVAVLLDLDLAVVMIAMAAVAIVYTTIGGLRADVYTDVVQLAVLWGSVVLCIGIAAHHLGDGRSTLSAVPRDRLHTIDIGATSAFGIAPMLLGGFFLYVSYYGCDQSQAQRLLALPSMKQIRRALFLNGVLRFPLAATLCAFGIVLGALVAVRPEFAAAIPSADPNQLVPQFLRGFVPPGLRGVVVAGILAAAMSSFDSAFNSLSAVTVHDFLEPRWGRQSTVFESRLCTAAWGMFCTIAGLAFAHSGSTVVELVNQIGSLFYGPVLGVFVVALHSRRATPSSAALGLVAGLFANAATWGLLPGVPWLWWNAIGFAACAGVAWVAGSREGAYGPDAHHSRGNALTAAGLAAVAAVMIVACVVFHVMAS